MSFLFACLLALAASDPASELGCRNLTDILGSQTVIFERQGTARQLYVDESEEHVWFRLSNNTTCTIKIPAVAPFKILTLPDGRLEVESIDGKEVAMSVTVTDVAAGGLPVYYGEGGESRLPPGQSVVFSIAATRVRRGPVAISYSYPWERSSSCCGRIERQVVFDVADLNDDPKFLAWLHRAKDPPRPPDPPPPPAESAPCAVADHTRGPQYLTYERYGAAPTDYVFESKERAWFRFHNNTTCAVTVRAGEPWRFQTPGYKPAHPDDVNEVAIDLSAFDPKTGDLSLHPSSSPTSPTTVLAGESVLFSVAANLLKRGPIAIPFAYAWEDSAAQFSQVWEDPKARDRIERRLVFFTMQDLRYQPEFFEWLEKVKDPPKRR